VAAGFPETAHKMERKIAAELKAKQNTIKKKVKDTEI
jgi:hypothetical protein